MTNYNERLDEILVRVFQRGINEELPDYYKVTLSVPEAKQAITSLIKELVAEAKPIETDDDEYADGWNDAIDQYHTNLLKALEEL